MAGGFETVGQKPERGVGTAVVVGCVATTIVVFVVVALGMWALTGSLGFSLVLSAFCTVWAGPGFGVMVGGVMNAWAEEKAAAARLLPVSTAVAGGVGQVAGDQAA